MPRGKARKSLSDAKDDVEHGDFDASVESAEPERLTPRVKVGAEGLRRTMNAQSKRQKGCLSNGEGAEVSSKRC